MDETLACLPACNARNRIAHPPDRKKKPAHRTRRCAGFFAGAPIRHLCLDQREFQTAYRLSWHVHLVKLRAFRRTSIARAGPAVAATRRNSGQPRGNGRRALAMRYAEGTFVSERPAWLFPRLSCSALLCGTSLVHHPVRTPHDRAAARGEDECARPATNDSPARSATRQTDRLLLTIAARTDTIAHPPALRKDAHRAHAARLQ